MKKYNRSEIMKRAWRIYRNYKKFTWRACLSYAWEEAKRKANDISPVVMNKIINGLRSFNRSRTITENKPMLAGTQEHFKLLNSKTGRRIMKLPIENDSKEMLAEGELFGLDIFHQRRKESNRFFDKKVKSKKTFRNRIINLETCVPINIEEYVNGK
jgi:hypothetical protein